MLVSYFFQLQQECNVATLSVCLLKEILKCQVGTNQISCPARHGYMPHHNYCLVFWHPYRILDLGLNRVKQ